MMGVFSRALDADKTVVVAPTAANLYLHKPSEPKLKANSRLCQAGLGYTSLLSKKKSASCAGKSKRDQNSTTATQSANRVIARR